MRIRAILPLILILALIIPSASFGSVGVSNESKYGMPVEFTVNRDYPGKIEIEGLYVYKDKGEYIFSLVYSGGNPATVTIKGKDVPKTSFINPPKQDTVDISWMHEPDRIRWDDEKIQFRVDAGKFLQVDSISIFVFDALYDNADQNIGCYFDVGDINLNKIPAAADLTRGYEVTAEAVSAELPGTPAAWALKDIEELKLSGVLNDTAFDEYEKNITRLRFVYLMTALYEKLTGDIIPTAGAASFADTDDVYALKAAKIGITGGIGGNLFGPDRELSREEMAAFVVRTLKLAGVNLDYDALPAIFADDAEISAWAREPVYTTRYFDIIGSTGENKFSPKLPATNQQALVIVRRLLGRFGGLEWYNEADSSRLYLRFREKLYKIELDKNMIIGDIANEKDLFCMSLEDTDTLLSLAHLKSTPDYEPDLNPNIEGTLKTQESNHMKLTVSNRYSGVDKIGETSTIRFSSDFSSDTVTVSVTTNDRLGTASYSGFREINYYDTAGGRNQMHALPIKEIFTTLGIDYALEYDENWNIYTIAFTPAS